MNTGTYNSPVRQLKIYFGNGTGGFTAGPVRSLSRKDPVPFVGQFSSDDSADILLFTRNFSGPGPAAPQILIGNGSGAFVDGATLPITNHPSHPMIGDFDNDGIDDVAVLDNSTGEVAVMLNNGSGAAKVTAQRTAIAAMGALSSGMTVDLDVDLDLLVDLRTSGEPLQTVVLLNDGRGLCPTHHSRFQPLLC